MVQIIQATCTNGELVLCEKLSPELEGKKVEIMIFDSNDSAETIDYKDSKIQQFLEQIKEFSCKLPPDYKFNRSEIYDR